MNLRQVLAIARYELLMAFRRRTIIIIGILFLIGIVAFTKVSLDANQSFMTISQVEGSVMTTIDETGKEVLLEQALPAWLQGVDINAWMGGSVIVTTLTITMIIASITLVMLVSEVIPLDGQYRMRELLYALPLSRSSYLMGKLLGAWFGLLIVTGVAIVVSAVWFRANFVYDFRYFLLLWAVLVIPVILVCAALAVLLTSWLTSRRVAILISLLVLPIALNVVVMAITSMTGVGIYLDQSYAYYAYVSQESRTTEVVTRLITRTSLGYIGLFFAAWGIAWAWQRFREAR